MTIRSACLEDAAELARLRWTYRTQDHARQGESAFLRECERWLRQALGSGRWFVAVASDAEGTLYGCIYLQCVAKVPVPGEIARAWGYITNSYVAPDHRGQGIGERLLSLAIDAARRRSLEFIILWPSPEAVSFYRRAGFRPAAEIHAREDDYPPLELELDRGSS